jgi:hypothetical protein
MACTLEDTFNTNCFPHAMNHITKILMEAHSNMPLGEYKGYIVHPGLFLMFQMEDYSGKIKMIATYHAKVDIQSRNIFLNVQFTNLDAHYKPTRTIRITITPSDKGPMQQGDITIESHTVRKFRYTNGFKPNQILGLTQLLSTANSLYF